MAAKVRVVTLPKCSYGSKDASREKIDVSSSSRIGANVISQEAVITCLMR